MIEKDRTYLIMGLLDPNSIAYAIGKSIESAGGKVVYTMLSERMKRIFFDRSKTIDKEERDALDIRFCDVTVEQEVVDLFDTFDDLAGVVHAIAYVNPKTGLGPEFHTEAAEDLTTGFHISAVSLATVARHAVPKMPGGGGIVALTFDSQRAFPSYNWMGVNKAALEAVVRGLARRHGKDNVRVNAVSAGPLMTKAASKIPGFQDLGALWADAAPIHWDPEEDAAAVADAVSFLISGSAAKITGQTLYVDGGMNIVGGNMLPHERP
ncbi:MAG TPA: enoyl-[acyl-carrier-protein] reductase FabI [Lentisphaeria bacterium]|nr:enoyl-[acyl-carrier-protein] reductase FabI [Lentisphaeria bacterium]